MPAQLKSLRISLGQYSDKGRKDTNQDFHGACIPFEPQLGSKGIAIAIADGVSSSEVSHIASEATVKAFLEDYFCTSAAWSVRKSAHRVLMAVNSWLYSQTRQSQYRYEKDRGYVSHTERDGDQVHHRTRVSCRRLEDPSIAGPVAGAPHRGSPRLDRAGSQLSEPRARHQSPARDRLSVAADRSGRPLRLHDGRRP